MVGYPAVELVGDATSDGFTFKATVPVYPEVTLGEYKGLTAEKEEVKVSAADVDERLKQLSDRNTRLVSVEREAKEGDTAVINFEGFLEGKPFDGGKGENHSLELGSHSFVPGFEEQVAGMKAGDEKDIDITFPEDYHADLAGKAVVFKVKCHEVKEKEVPEMDDEFAKDVSEFDTLKELKADLKKKISEERQKAADREFEDALMTKVAEGITAEIPDAMVENQARQFVENFKMQITQQGIPYDQYAQMTGITEAKLLEDAKEPALRQVRMDLALAAVIKAENIEASDEEVEDEFKNQVISRKAVAVVVDSATAVKPEKKTAKKAAKKAEDKDEAAEGEEKPKKAAKKTAKKAAEGEEKAAKKAADDEEKPVKKSTKKAAKEAKKEEE